MAYIRQLPSGLWAATVHTPAGRITETRELQGCGRGVGENLEADINRGDFLDPRHGKHTVGEVWEKYAPARRLEMASRKRDASTWKVWVAPTWAEQPVGVDPEARRAEVGQRARRGARAKKVDDDRRAQRPQGDVGARGRRRLDPGQPGTQGQAARSPPARRPGHRAARKRRYSWTGSTSCSPSGATPGCSSSSCSTPGPVGGSGRGAPRGGEPASRPGRDRPGDGARRTIREYPKDKGEPSGPGRAARRRAAGPAAAARAGDRRRAGWCSRPRWAARCGTRRGCGGCGSRRSSHSLSRVRRRTIAGTPSGRGWPTRGFALHDRMELMGHSDVRSGAAVHALGGPAVRRCAGGAEARPERIMMCRPCVMIFDIAMGIGSNRDQ
jgi:hypothetical protein